MTSGDFELKGETCMVLLWEIIQPANVTDILNKKKTANYKYKIYISEASEEVEL